jgi:iron complex transport system permease protein
MGDPRTESQPERKADSPERLTSPSPIQADSHVTRRPGRERRHGRWLGVFGTMTVLCFIVSLLLGEMTEDFAKKGLFEKVAAAGQTVLRHAPLVGKAFESPQRDEQMDQIIWDIRVPRLILALLVGASLSAAGAVMQCFFQNPMASPYIVGVSSGAALGATVAFAFNISIPVGSEAVGFLRFLADQPVALLAFAGGLGVTFTVYLLSRRGGKIHLPTLLLTGIALGTLALALAWFVLFLRRPYDYEGIIFWLMGSFNGRGWGRVAMIFPYVLMGVIFISIFARDLNVLLLGEETAQHLGVHVERMKLLLLIASTVLAAACVAAVGVIGFVGLVVPHVTRLLVGPDHRRLIPACLLGGGLLLMLADDAARILFDEMIPIGVITAMLGCPFFLYLLTRKEKRLF